MPGGCSDRDVVKALLDLIDKAGGKLYDAQVVMELAMQNFGFIREVEAAGGLRKFCAAHPEVELVTSMGRDDYVQRRAVAAKDVVDALLKLIDEASGKLSGAHVFTQVGKVNPGFRAIVDAAGGLKKFCAAHPEVEFITDCGAGYVKRQAPKVSQQDVVDALLKLIDNASGKLSGAQAVTQVGNVNPGFRAIVDAAGGLKKFCAAHPEVEFITDGGAGYVKRQAPKVSQRDVVDALLKLIDKAGGKINGGQVMTELCKQSPALKSTVDAAGGLKKFCASHRDLEFINDCIQRRAPEVSAQDVVDTLLELIDKASGKINGAQVVTALGGRNPAFKGVVAAAGGPKKFCASHRELQFITVAGADGYVQRRAPQATAQDVVNALLGLIEKAGGKIDGTKISLELGKMNPAFRAKVDAVGGPKKFCEQHADLQVVMTSGGPWHVKRRAVARSLGRDAKGRVTLRVSDVRWSQDSIKVTFRQGNFLIDLLEELLDDPSSLQCLPPLDVVEHDGCWYAISGNRRLWVLKEYARLKDPALSIPVRIRSVEATTWAFVFKMRFTTTNRGMHPDIVLQHRLKTKQRFPTMHLALEAMLRKRRLAATKMPEVTTDSDESSSPSTSSTASSSHTLETSTMKRRVALSAELQARRSQVSSQVVGARRPVDLRQLC